MAPRREDSPAGAWGSSSSSEPGSGVGWGGTWKNTGLIWVVWGEMGKLGVPLLPFRGSKAS